MRWNPLLFASCLLLLAMASPANAGWTRKAGEMFFSQSLSYYETYHFINDAGVKSRQPRFAKEEWNGYIEYGYTDDLTLGANLFFHRLESDFAFAIPSANLLVYGTIYNYGFADAELFARKRLWKNDNAVLSIQPILKLPSWYYYDIGPRGGTDNFDTELRLQYGLGFDAFDEHHHLKLEGGYRKRFGPWHDQWKLDATLGIALTSAITIMPQLFITQRAEGRTQNASTSAIVSDYDLIKGQLSFLYRINHRMTLQLGAFSHLRSRNTGDGQGIMTGVWYHF